MHMADRMHQLRKSKGISQEELADKIGVSRQAISKWESGQSAPDIDKAILLSDYFGVTTDYLLKGVEAVSNDVQPKQEKPNANIFAIAATVFTFMGIIVSAAIWYEEQSAVATAIGLIFSLMGCMIFAIGIVTSDRKTIARAKQRFVRINLWVVPFIPLSILYNTIMSGTFAPYPVAHGGDLFASFLLFWLFYISYGIIFTLVLKIKAMLCNKRKV